MRRLLWGCLLLAGCDHRDTQLNDCIALYGTVQGATETCLVRRYGWDSTDAHSAEMTHRKILQDNWKR